MNQWPVGGLYEYDMYEYYLYRPVYLTKIERKSHQHFIVQFL